MLGYKNDLFTFSAHFFFFNVIFKTDSLVNIPIEQLVLYTNAGKQLPRAATDV